MLILSPRYLRIEAILPLPRKSLGRIVQSICFSHDNVFSIRYIYSAFLLELPKSANTTYVLLVLSLRACRAYKRKYNSTPSPPAIQHQNRGLVYILSLPASSHGSSDKNRLTSQLTTTKHIKLKFIHVTQ